MLRQKTKSRKNRTDKTQDPKKEEKRKKERANERKKEREIIITAINLAIMGSTGRRIHAHTLSSAEPVSCIHAVYMKRGREKAFSRAVDSS